MLQIEIRNSKKQKSEIANRRREVRTICKQCSGQAFFKMLYLRSYLKGCGWGEDSQGEQLKQR